MRLLFLPPSAGYEQNPICVYYVYDENTDGAEGLQRCIAEVTNTPWGDKVRFAFTPDGFTLPKPMHVSPLQDMEASWGLSTAVDAGKAKDALRLSVHCAHPEMGHFFDARLDARPIAPPADVEAWAWLQPHRVTYWIYLHAASLMWRGLPFLAHPKYDASGRDAFQALAKQRAAKAGVSGSDGPPGCCPYVWRNASGYPWA